MVLSIRPFVALLLAATAAAPAAAAGSAAPAAILAVAGGELRAALRATLEGSELELTLARPDGSTAPLPSPAPRLAARIDEPVPIAVAGELAGLAWLEGGTRESYGVRYAPWTGAGWGAVEEVAPPGPGSQLALGAARLADGRLLLVWAGWDGGDDEIRFALRDAGGGWSAPARVAADNDVPDITPAVTAAGEGALVAWSRYVDGQYRVAVARYDGERFRAAKLIGRPGTLYPSFEAPAPHGGPRLLFRNARPAGWTVVQLDRSGAVERQFFVEAPDAARPTGIRIKGERIELVFGDGPGGAARR